VTIPSQGCTYKTWHGTGKGQGIIAFDYSLTYIIYRLTVQKYGAYSFINIGFIKADLVKKKISCLTRLEHSWINTGLSCLVVATRLVQVCVISVLEIELMYCDFLGQ